jgi:hypothetical protein
MLPNTENAMQRISKLTSRPNSNSNSKTKTKNIVSIRASELDEDILDSYEGTFTSSEFQNMYATTTTGVGMNDRSQTEYKCIYAIEDELYINGLPETFDVRKYTGGNENMCNINICVYRICKGNNAFPYLQYKLMLDQQKNTLKFPTFTHRFDATDDSSNSNSDIEFMQTKFMKRANENVMKWYSGISSDNLEFKGIYHYNPVSTGEVIDSIHPSFSADMDGGKPRKKKYNNRKKYYNKKERRYLDKQLEERDSESNSNSNSESDSQSSSENDSYTSSGSDNDTYSERSFSKHNTIKKEALYLFYQDTTFYEYDTIPIEVTHGSEWWWVCIHEIFNSRRVLYNKVGKNVNLLFKSEPTALFLMNERGNIYETPHVLYKGLPEHVSLDEMRCFGPRKDIDDNNISSYRKKNHMEKNINEVLLHGSHFYFYEFCDSIRGACYTYDDVTRKYEKNKSQHGQYIFRYVVFLGKMKTLVFDTGNGTNHLSINNACMTREVNWPTEGYHSICHGKYTLRKGGGKESDTDLKSKYLYSAFSVSDPHRFISLTYHRVDSNSIPPDIETIFKRNFRYAIKIK